MAEKPVADLYFDAGCPWSYLAHGRLREAAIRTGARVSYHPVLVDEVLARSNPGFPPDRRDPVPARAAYQGKDLADWARYCGLVIQRPAAWPLRTEWAARGAVVATGTGQAVPYLTAVFEALFRDGRDITDPAVVCAAAAAAGLDPLAFESALREEGPLAQVRANGEELLARGGFGTPSILIGNDLYFGNDRLPLVEAALARAGNMRLVLPGAHGSRA